MIDRETPCRPVNYGENTGRREWMVIFAVTFISQVYLNGQCMREYMYEEENLCNLRTINMT